MVRRTTSALILMMAAGVSAASEPPVIAGGFSIPESAIHDESRDLYIVVSMGDGTAGHVSLLNPDGTTKESRWLVHGRDGVELVRPLGSEIHGGILYVADTPFVRSFGLASGKSIRSVRIPDTTLLNDLAVAADGTVYVTDTGNRAKALPGAIYRIAPDGAVTPFATGADVANPNGIAIDKAGNIANVAMASTLIFIRSPEGRLLSTIDLGHDGNDGIAVLENGAFVVSSLSNNLLLHIGADGQVKPLAEVERPASIGLDAKRRLIIVPQLRNNSVTLVPIAGVEANP